MHVGCTHVHSSSLLSRVYKDSWLLISKTQHLWWDKPCNRKICNSGLYMPIVRGVRLWTFLRRWDSIQWGQWEQLQRAAERSWAGLPIKESKSLSTAHQSPLHLAATPLSLSGITLPELTLILPSALFSMPHLYQVCSALGLLYLLSFLLECLAPSSWYRYVLLVRSRAKRLLNSILSPLY